jgi:hypothetical protein
VAHVRARRSSMIARGDALSSWTVGRSYARELKRLPVSCALAALLLYSRPLPLGAHLDRRPVAVTQREKRRKGKMEAQQGTHEGVHSNKMEETMRMTQRMRVHPLAVRPAGSSVSRLAAELLCPSAAAQPPHPPPTFAASSSRFFSVPSSPLRPSVLFPSSPCSLRRCGFHPASKCMQASCSGTRKTSARDWTGKRGRKNSTSESHGRHTRNQCIARRTAPLRQLDPLHRSCLRPNARHTNWPSNSKR